MTDPESETLVTPPERGVAILSFPPGGRGFPDFVARTPKPLAVRAGAWDFAGYAH